MASFPCLVRFSSPPEETRYFLGHPLVDSYLEFVVSRCRPSTLRAAAFDLKAFFGVVDKDPVEVTVSDVCAKSADLLRPFGRLARNRCHGAGDEQHSS